MALSQATLTLDTNQQNPASINTTLETLTKVVKDVAENDNALDPKLADYIFFPLSQVLKFSQRLPVRSMELSLQLLSVLIAKGWRQQVASSLSSQLLILLSFMAEKSSTKPVMTQTTDELQTAAFRCLSDLFLSLSLSTTGKASLADTANVPSLGHAVTVMLSGVSDGASQELQLSAAHALSSLLVCLTDHEAVSSFLPGMVSVLSKVLTPSTKSRRHWKVLEECLRVLNKLIQLTVSDRVVASALHATDISRSNGDLKKKRLDSDWLQATARQLKLAVANVYRLRSHSREEIRDQLMQVSLTILNDCKKSLPNCAQMAIEAATIIVSDAAADARSTDLEFLIQFDTSARELLEATLHDWLVALPRVMQSNDETAKERRIKHVFTAVNLLASGGTDMRLLNRMVNTALCDSLTSIMRLPNQRSDTSQRIEHIVALDLPLLNLNTKSLVFNTPLTESTTQENLLQLLRSQIYLTSQKRCPILPGDFSVSMRGADGEMQIAGFWLLLTTLQATAGSKDPLEEFFDISLTANDRSDLIEDVYSFSLSILEDDTVDWRLQMLSLEGVALQARDYGQEFRGELVDALYPILCHIGSENPRVRNHAITCLNIVSDACAYTDVKDLIVSNVDYLTNAVALKLNAFDVSPQGPQVLLMMVRLAGPTLLPYLEDVVESIFAALEDYHGYTTLVELLFAVLRTMAEEGVKAPLLSITDGKEDQNNTKSHVFTTTDELVQMLMGGREKRKLGEKMEHTPPNTPHSREPWKLESKAEGLHQDTDESLSNLPTTEADAPSEERETPPPAPKTYALLLKITQLTQHYLSSSSPSLRISLLSLIRTTVPSLAKHENSYLPLINTLWPAVVSRLHDEEGHVVAGAMDIIATMCVYAGDFMRSRIRALWTDLVALHSKIQRSLDGHSSREKPRLQPQSSLLLSTANSDTLTPSPPIYIDATLRTQQHSFTQLMAAIVSHVAIDAELFDDVLVMLQPVRKLPPDVLQVLERYNADAVWLCGLEKSSYSTGERKGAAGVAVR